MLAITPRCAMTAPLHISPAMAATAQLRHWAKHDAQRLALAIAWRRYGEDDARRELATTLAWHAERAKISGISCRALAANMLEDELAELDEHLNAVRQRMIEAAEIVLRNNSADRLAAAIAAADIARAARVPPDMIDAALNIALWRTRRRA